MKKVITISATALAILSMFFISFSFIDTGSVHAESSDSQASLTLDPVIDISAPSSVTLNCTPGSTDAQAELCTSTANIVVNTNNITGYTLQMNATSGSPTALTNSAASPAATIPTLSQAYPSANFPVNSWGYTGGLDKSEETGGYDCSTNYCPILAYNSDPTTYAPNHIINQTDAPSTTSTTSITFAGKVNTTKPSGTYSTSVTFTAVTNYVPHPITNGMSMTDIDSSTCSDTPTDVTYTVEDPRDHTNYTVAKLQDGNCWMTQNLALGGSTAMNLTQADSNVGSGGFTLPASVSEGDWAGSYTTPEFFDYAGNYPSQQAINKYGNYYNWPAATAGTNPSSGDSQYSICPKNWRLPSASSTDATDSEFYKMLNPYITTGSWSGSSWSSVTTTNFTNAPVSLVFSGDYYGGLGNQGSTGFFWSATASGSDDAGNLYARSSGRVYPRDIDSKDYGNSIRCLVPGGA